MQEQISDGAPETDTSEPAPAAPTTERRDTTYVVLNKRDGVTWEVVAEKLVASSTRDALQTYVEGREDLIAEGAVLVAVASRSWKPVPVGIRTETITRVVIGE